MNRNDFKTTFDTKSGTAFGSRPVKSTGAVLPDGRNVNVTTMRTITFGVRPLSEWLQKAKLA